LKFEENDGKTQRRVFLFHFSIILFNKKFINLPLDKGLFKERPFICFCTICFVFVYFLFFDYIFIHKKVGKSLSQTLSRSSTTLMKNQPTKIKQTNETN